MMRMMMLGPQHPPLHLNEGEAMESEVRIEKDSEEEETYNGLVNHTLQKLCDVLVPSLAPEFSDTRTKVELLE